MAPFPSFMEISQLLIHDSELFILSFRIGNESACCIDIAEKILSFKYVRSCLKSYRLGSTTDNMCPSIFCIVVE